MQLVDYRVSNRGPFPEFLLYFRQTVVRTTHLEQSTKGRNNPPMVGATHGRCASPPPLLESCWKLYGKFTWKSDHPLKLCLKTYTGKRKAHIHFNNTFIRDKLFNSCTGKMLPNPCITNICKRSSSWIYLRVWRKRFSRFRKPVLPN